MQRVIYLLRYMFDINKPWILKCNLLFPFLLAFLNTCSFAIFSYTLSFFILILKLHYFILSWRNQPWHVRNLLEFLICDVTVTIFCTSHSFVKYLPAICNHYPSLCYILKCCPVISHIKTILYTHGTAHGKKSLLTHDSLVVYHSCLLYTSRCV